MGCIAIGLAAFLADVAAVGAGDPRLEAADLAIGPGGPVFLPIVGVDAGCGAPKAVSPVDGAALVCVPAGAFATPPRDPTGAQTSMPAHRAVRGGYWGSDARHLRASCRDSYYFYFPSWAIGFRCALTVR
jgi:hypothetical protein